MKRSILVAALLGMSSALPALASERVAAKSDHQPVTLNDQQLDDVTAGDLLGLNLNLTALDTLNANLQANLNLPRVNSPGLLGNGVQGATSPLGGLLNTATGLLGNLGL
jgi:hypothetical protein